MKKRNIAMAMTVLFLVALFSFIVSAEGEEFTVTITAPEKVVAGRDFMIMAEITDIQSGTEIAGLDFYLHYDKTKVMPLYEQTQEMLGEGYLADTTLITSTPNGSPWEQAALLNKVDGVYTIRLFAGDTGSSISCITSTQGLTLAIPFRGLETEEDVEAVFEVDGVTGANRVLDSISGFGSLCSTIVLSDTDPIITLGAKVNSHTVSLRMGAQYNANFIPEGAETVNLGIVIYPKHLLGDNDLTVATPGAIVARAVAIENYDPTKTFADYESITYYATIRSIPYHGTNRDISFVSFYTYVLDGITTTVYGEKLNRSYNYVYEVNYGTAPGGTSGDNTVIIVGNWWN